jgi:biopolymer transport protein ExbB
MSTIETIKELLLRFGTGWVLWLLAGLSLASLAISIERWLFFRSRGADLAAMATGLHRHLDTGDVAGAIAALDRSSAAAARIASAGLRLADRGPAAVDRAMQSAASLEQAQLERWLAFLGTLGNNAPFIGLFGTVIGIIGAFEELGHGAPGHGGPAGAAAAAQLASQAVMSSIAEALVATAVGLLVALPAVAANNYFQRRVATLLGGTGALSNLVLAYLAQPPAPAEGA